MPQTEIDEQGDKVDWFSLWNFKLLGAFFSPASKGDPVWLQVDPAELDALGPELGGDEGFLKAVRRGPAWGTLARSGYFARGSTSDLVERVNGLVSQRQSARQRPRAYIDPSFYSKVYENKNAPTYLPFLAALVRSVTESERGYYPSLRDALQLGSSWGSGEMEALERAWVDLQEWTKHTGGEFGIFKFRILGGYPHVGVPRAQSIMAKRDSEMVSRIFTQVGARVGQAFSNTLSADIMARAAEANFLTRGFKAALGRPEFREPIEVRLRVLFAEWDGRKVTAPGTNRDGHAANSEVVDRGDVELCLCLQDGDVFHWNIHWRVPPFHASGEIILSRGGAHWIAPVRGSEYVSTVGDDGAAQRAALNALQLSGSNGVDFQAFVGQDTGETAELGTVFLRQALLRVLIWRFDEFANRYELHEHPFPHHGSAYLLTVAQNAVQLDGWLKREAIEHEVLETVGLPRGWMLVCVRECSTLTEDQRNCLPDGESERDQYRPVRLTGGRSVNRGGIRQYMAYDLPIIELDAPIGTLLESTALDFAEEARAGDPLHKMSIRRFRVSPRVSSVRSFKIVAILGGKELGRVVMRVASDSGEHVEVGNTFSLDSLGNPLRIGSGMRGALDLQVACAGIPPVEKLELALSDLGRLVSEETLACTLKSGALQFLDTLGNMGSMAYGTARDQLARLLGIEGSRVQATLMLLHLRGRGHLEIETNGKGHMIRIYSVSPMLYSLEATHGGREVFGILGTLRLQNWKSLAVFASGCEVRCAERNDGWPRAWRIVVHDRDQLERFAGEHGFSIQHDAAIRIATWAATCDDVRGRTEKLAGESAGKATWGIEKLNPNKGLFYPAESVVFNRPGPSCQLFRMEDRDTTGMRVYSLGLGNEGGSPRFGFVRDSRWGIWIALGAFASFFKEMCGHSDASPWPVPYLSSDGTILLPARVSLPAVLERAVNLCSGNGPESIEVTVVREPAAMHITLARAATGTTIARVSGVYHDMADGKWLAYRYVPKAVAALIVGKLGGKLVEC